MERDTRRFQRNVELFAASHPKVAVHLPYVESTHFSFCRARKGQLNLVKQLEDKTFYFHSAQDPEQEARAWFSRLSLKRATVLYVYGVGLGYYYDVAKSWLRQSKRHRLVFLEDDICVIYFLLHTGRGTKILRDPQVELHYFHSLQDEEVFEWLSWNFVREEFHLSALRFYAKERPETLADLHHKLSYNAAMKSSAVEEYLCYGAPFFRNFYPNLYELPGAYLGNRLFGKFRGVPAVICGAGPSLKKNLHVLQEIRDCALIFAGGSALKALSVQGCRPHFAAGIDPNPAHYKTLQGNTAYEVPFLYRNRILHEAFQVIYGPRLYLVGSGGYDVAEWFEKKLKIPGKSIDEGHNVLNFCVQIAYELGCSPIVFIGMDLAYTGMQAYADGVVKDSKVKKRALMQAKNWDNRALLRKDIYGKPVYTLWKWIAESDWIARFAKEHPQASFINTTEGGIGFEGVPNRPLVQVVEQFFLRSYDLANRVHGAVQNARMPQVTQKKVTRLLEQFSESFSRSLELLNTILLEMDRLIKKRRGELLTTGQMALCETELMEEPAYRYVLETFNVVYSHVLNREWHQLKTQQRRSSAAQQRKVLELNKKRYVFLRDTAKFNLEVIRSTLRQKRE